MINTWFTSDTHFQHASVIRHSQRPFSSVTEMDDTMVKRWNEVVGRHDQVWHLGDFSWHGSRGALRILDRLQGGVHLVWGNHDDNQTRKLSRWLSSQPYAEIKLDGVRLVLFHYAMKVWNRAHHGAIHLYGHSHRSLPGDSQSCDVGVDCWDFRPVSLGQIKERLAQSPLRDPVDHHGQQENELGDAA